jgi:hypothetical protein
VVEIGGPGHCVEASEGSILGKGLAEVHAPKGGIRPGASPHEGDLILESDGRGATSGMEGDQEAWNVFAPGV